MKTTYQSIAAAHIAELTEQRDNLLAQVNAMGALIQTFPRQLTSARLDAKEGKQTKYDYDRHAKVCAVDFKAPVEVVPSDEAIRRAYWANVFEANRLSPLNT